jgi:thioesterase domain-containing protein
MIVPLKPTGNLPPLFVIHGSDGLVEPFLGLLPYLNPDQPVFGIAQPLKHSGPALTNLKRIVAHYVNEIQDHRIAGPYCLLGYSFGGVVAFEMAIQLKRLGETVLFLGMLDAWLPIRFSKGSAPETPLAKGKRKFIHLFRHLNSFLFGPDRVRWFRETVVSKLLIRVYRSMTEKGRDIPVWLRNANDLNLFAVSGYEPEQYSGRIVLIRARDEYRDQRWSFDLGWGRVAEGGVEILELPGTHRELVRASPKTIADLIARYLPEPVSGSRQPEL